MDMDDPLVMLALEHGGGRLDPPGKPFGIEREREDRFLAQCMDRRQHPFAQLAFAGRVEAGERQLMTFRGKRVPCLSLGEILGTETNQDTDWQDKTLVLIRLASEDVFALAVDRVYDHEDVVVKPIAPAIMETRLYAGTTLLDDGRPMMLLDLPSIAEQRQLVNEMRSSTRVDEEEQVERRKAHPVMLFTGLDGRRRAVRLELVRRIDTIAREAIDIEGARAQAVIDGAIFSLVGQEYGDLPEDKCRLLRLSDGECEVVYAACPYTTLTLPTLPPL